MKIIYDDESITVCIKPSGVLSTDGPGGLPELLRQIPEFSDVTFRTVHRLDRVVAGLMVLAKNSLCASELSRQITEGTFQKEYYACVHGIPEKQQDLLTDYLFRDSGKNMTYVVKRMRKGVREAALEYEVLGTEEGLSLLRIHLLTGRTHQIRAQFSSRAMPLAGDRKYGAASDRCPIALWSCFLRFTHPLTGTAMEFYAKPPAIEPWTLFPEYCDVYDMEDYEIPDRRLHREILNELTEL